LLGCLGVEYGFELFYVLYHPRVEVGEGRQLGQSLDVFVDYAPGEVIHPLTGQIRHFTCADQSCQELRELLSVQQLFVKEYLSTHAEREQKFVPVQQ